MFEKNKIWQNILLDSISNNIINKNVKNNTSYREHII